MVELDSITCIDALELCAQLGDASVDLILSDLPYQQTGLHWDIMLPLDPMWEQFKRIVKPHGAIVLTATNPFAARLISSNYEMFKYDWLWLKSNASDPFNAPNKPMEQHESVLVFSQGATANLSPRRMNYYPQGVVVSSKKKLNDKRVSSTFAPRPSHQVRYVQRTENNPTTVLRFDNDKGHHPTQKPLKLFQYLIKTYTREGEIVFDPCVGSGTTALAAYLANRRYICGDISAEYVSVAKRRLQNADPYKTKDVTPETLQHSLFEDSHDRS